MNTIDTPSLTQLKKEVEMVTYFKGSPNFFLVGNAGTIVWRKRNNIVGR
jgi:hypothetical protein